jgi:peptidoglycan/LPS O-acetylase OafA/YrhL
MEKDFSDARIEGTRGDLLMTVVTQTRQAKPSANGMDFSRVHQHMDGLRGVLVFWVILAHVFYLSVYTHGPDLWNDRMILYFHPVLAAVGLFVMISGFCLMLPVAHSNSRFLSGGIGNFLRRRTRRIAPPYYAALVLSLLHIYFFKSTYARWWVVQDPWHPMVLISHLLFFYNLNPLWRYQINAPFWSLATEWQLYLLFAFLLVPIWKRFGVRALLGVTFLGSCLLIGCGRAVCQAHPWYLLLFAMGMTGAVLTSSTNPKVLMWRDRLPWARISVVLLVVFAVEWITLFIFIPTLFLPLAWQQYCFTELVFSLALLSAFMHWNKVQRELAPHQWPLVLRLLHHKQIMWLGSISYSLYLIHWPILISLIGFIRACNLGETLTLVLAYLVAVPLTIGLGYLFFLAVERRFLPAYAKKRQPSLVLRVPAPDSA